MTNKIKGEVPLRLSDGRELTLVMDFEMRVQVEELCDKPFSDVAQRASAGFHGAVRALLWGALRRHHPELTMGDVTALIEEHSGELEDAMSRAAEAAMPSDATEGKKPANPPRKRPAGKTSGGNGAKRA